jgi:O-antigen/teichoic acid export membrane protein
LVLTLLTEKWSPAVPYLQMLAIVGLLYPLHMINLNVLLAKGRSDLFFRLEIIKKSMAVVVIGLAVILRWEIEVIIVGQVVTSMIAYVLNSYYNQSVVGYGTRAQLRDLWPYLAVAGMMGAVVYSLAWLPFTHSAVLLLTQVITGGLVYALLCRGLRLPVFMDAWQLAQGRIVALRMA